MLDLLVSGLVQGLIVGLLALSVTLAFGVARFANAAAGDTATLGAYAALVAGEALAPPGAGLWVGAPAAALAGAGAGLLGHALVFGRLAARAPVARLVASIGFAFLLRAAFGLLFGHAQRVYPVPLERPWRFLDGAVRIAPMDLRLAATAAGAVLVVFLVLHRTPIGRQMRAVADDPDLARVCGVRPGLVLAAMWALAGAVAGVAGLMAGLKTVVEPELGWNLLLPAFAAAVLGGIGSPGGALLAGVLLGVAQELSTPLAGFTYKLALSFLVLLLVLVRPRGLFGRLEAAR